MSISSNFRSVPSVALKAAPQLGRPDLLTRMLAAIAREIRIRRDLRRLQGFDDAMLHDIGLARGGLEEAVRHGRAGASERGEDWARPAPCRARGTRRP